MAGDIILLIVPASEITHRHPPFYCRSFKRDISDINPEPLIILSSLCKYCPVSLQQYKNQSQAQDALADSLNQKQAEVGVLHPVLCFLSDNQIPDQTPVLVTSQHQALSCSPPPQPDFHPIWDLISDFWMGLPRICVATNKYLPRFYLNYESFLQPPPLCYVISFKNKNCLDLDVLSKYYNIMVTKSVWRLYCESKLKYAIASQILFDYLKDINKKLEDEDSSMGWNTIVWKYK